MLITLRHNFSFQVGFGSLGSFSWLFHRRVGVSPQAFRKRKYLLSLLQKGDFQEAPHTFQS
jgi:AraC-like DNA-binding protein